MMETMSVYDRIEARVREVLGDPYTQCEVGDAVMGRLWPCHTEDFKAIHGLSPAYVAHYGTTPLHYSTPPGGGFYYRVYDRPGHLAILGWYPREAEARKAVEIHIDRILEGKELRRIEWECNADTIENDPLWQHDLQPRYADPEPEPDLEQESEPRTEPSPNPFQTVLGEEEAVQ